MWQYEKKLQYRSNIKIPTQNTRRLSLASTADIL